MCQTVVRLENLNESPSLQTGQRTTFHDLDAIACLGRVLFVVDVADGSASNRLTVFGMGQYTFDFNAARLIGTI
jgi:hypothetical protein